MSITIDKYKVGDFELYPYKGTVDAETYYGYGTTYGPAAAFEKQEDQCLTVYLYKDHSTGLLSLHTIADSYQDGSGGNCHMTITNVPSGAYVAAMDDNADEYYKDTSTSFVLDAGWAPDYTDGGAMENINGFTNIDLNMVSSSGLSKWKLCSNDGSVKYIDFSTTTSITLTHTQETLSGYLSLSPEPSIYNEPIDISTFVSSDIAEVVFTDNGNTPTKAEYLAYDDLSPPNPIVAIVEDGKGPVVFDGGFPKWYNSKIDSGWSVFSDLSASFKYFINALNYIANKEKVTQGNKKVLFINDVTTGQNYNIRETGSSDFATSIDLVCSIGGYTPVIRDISDFGDGRLDFSYSFINQHCAVVFFGTDHLSTDTTLPITEECVTNLVNFRENGNGLFLITDHGSEITTIDTATNGTYRGFFACVNKVAVNFGAWFSGSYDRTNVNVGYIRNTYGDHPLWENILDTENLAGGGSESRVYITEYPIHTSQSVPILQLTEDGYTNFKFLLKLADGSLVNETYTYGLNVPEVIVFKDMMNNIIEQTKLTVFNKIDFIFELGVDSLSHASGLMKKNGKVVGEVNYDSVTTTKFWYKGSNEEYINDGDILTVEISSPMSYSKSLKINRVVSDELSLSRFIEDTNRAEWEVADDRLSTNHLFHFLDTVSISPTISPARNVRYLKQYMRNEYPLSDGVGLIYETSSSASNELVNYTPPSMEDIFNTWGVFAAGGAAGHSEPGDYDDYYPTIFDAPNTTPFSTWGYNSTIDSIVQSHNSGWDTGFVSNEKTKNYTHEAIVTSSSHDDDSIGLVIAHNYVNGTNCHLTVHARQDNTTYTFQMFYQKNNAKPLIINRWHDPGGGWLDRKVRIRVVREDNYITAIATKWDDIDNYDETSKISIDLLDYPELSDIYGEASYGYYTHSQDDSKYQDVVFKGGLDRSVIVDYETGIVYTYKNNTWINSGRSVQDIYGYPRRVTNPETNKTYLITESDIQLIS